VPQRILIVDDSPAIRRALRKRFEWQTGWEVCGDAACGQDGIAKAEELRPDLIIIDFSMRAMNGLEVARELRRRLPAVPLLMFTNFENDHLRNAAESAGISAVVRKSESFQALVSSMRELLGRAVVN
jgi:DNA-binding NarL/FixJ family response regulator